jgi:uncharacterized membrane protein YfcA
VTKPDSSKVDRAEEASGAEGGGVSQLPLVVTVGFAGHRAIEDPAGADALLSRAFAVVGEALAALPSQPLDAGEEALGQAYDGEQRARLLTGAAPGADRLAIAQWRKGRYGEIHALFPFRDPATSTPLTDDPEHATVEDRVEDLSIFAASSGIDAVALGIERNRAHSEIGRWIVRHCDLLVALWNGAPAQGLGGTGDTVRRALERGLPVVWVRPGDDQVRLLEPHEFHRHSQLDEALAAPQSIATPLTSAALLAALIAPFAPPPSQIHGSIDPEVASRKDFARVDPLKRRFALISWRDTLLDHTIWSAFSSFKKTVGDLRHWKPPETAPTPQPGPIASSAGYRRIQAAFEVADRRANRLSAIHRSQQLLLIYVAVLAVFFGAAPALPPIQGLHIDHLQAAWAELLLGIFALLISTYAQRAHRHRRWSDARRLAERLRAALATWPLGVDLADASERPAFTWTEWRARAVLRDAGPPPGWLDRDEFSRRAALATSLLIEGQIRYHSREYHLAETIDRRIKIAEGLAFGVLMIAVASFLVASSLTTHMPSWVFGVLTMISAVSPSVGAACLALEATNGFGEIARRSSRMGPEFERLRAEIDIGRHPLHQTEVLQDAAQLLVEDVDFWRSDRDAGRRLSLHHRQEVLRNAAQLLVEDADSWRDRVVSRRIVRGG